MFVISTFVAFKQRNNGKVTRKEFNHIAFAGLFGIAGGIIGAGIGGGLGFGLGLKLTEIFGNGPDSPVWYQLILAISGTIVCAIPGAKNGRYYFKCMFAWLENIFFQMKMSFAKSRFDIMMINMERGDFLPRK